MRARLLKPGFFDDSELAALPIGARLLFAGLWCMADREGRLVDAPRKIAGDIFPHDNDISAGAVDEWLSSLCPSHITRYSSGGAKYIYINNFKKHQAVNARERESEIPPPPKRHVKSPCEVSEMHVQRTDIAREKSVQCTLPPEAEAEAEAEAVQGRAVHCTDTPDLPDLARRIHRLHPSRKGTVQEVERALTLQLADEVNLDSRVAEAERNHAGWCRSEDWQKENHRFVPLLPRWIREGRIWEEPPEQKSDGYISVFDLPKRRGS